MLSVSPCMRMTAGLSQQSHFCPAGTACLLPGREEIGPVTSVIVLVLLCYVLYRDANRIRVLLEVNWTTKNIWRFWNPATLVVDSIIKVTKATDKIVVLSVVLTALWTVRAFSLCV